MHSFLNVNVFTKKGLNNTEWSKRLEMYLAEIFMESQVQLNTSSLLCLYYSVLYLCM